MIEIEIRTRSREEAIEITDKIEEAVRAAGKYNGACIVYVPHTTAALIINENADRSVIKDIMNKLKEIAPQQANYLHLEGNADAHIKASIIHTHKLILIKNGKLVLGKWQGIFFLEFDGPRSRKIILEFI